MPELSPWALFLLAAATQRLLTLWLSEKIAEPLRAPLLARGGWLAYWAACGYCLSVWFGATLLGLWWVGGPIGRAVVIVLALSSLTLAWNSITAILAHVAAIAAILTTAAASRGR